MSNIVMMPRGRNVLLSLLALLVALSSVGCAAPPMETGPFGRIFKIALTGGPCGGKTTVISKLTDAFENVGWKVFRASEVATILLGGGVDFASLNREEVFHFQLNLFRTMMAMEKVYDDLAQSVTARGQNCLIICDRGAMDVSAYMEPEEWVRLLETEGKSEVELRDERYDCVVHMRTAAAGAQAHYNTDGNEARREGPELARHLDERLLKAWTGHPYYVIVDNSTDFEAKLERTIKAALFRAGLPDVRDFAGFGPEDVSVGHSPVQRRKFVLATAKGSLPVLPEGVKFVDFDVEHRMLYPSDDGATFYRLRRRAHGGQAIYTLASSTIDNAGVRCEARRNLSGREYEAMLRFTDPDYDVVAKARRVFVWEGRFYQADLFLAKQKGLVLLEAYIPRDAALPAFLPEPIAEVTDDPTYKLINLSHIYS